MSFPIIKLPLFIVFVIVLICRRPRGTGFLKFSAAPAAEAAVSASNAAPGLGIVIKGRSLKVTNAIDKESAQKKEAEKAKSEVQDRRNLYLAKVEVIPVYHINLTFDVEYYSALFMSSDCFCFW